MLCLPASPVTFVPLPQTPFGFKSGEEATSRLQELNQSVAEELGMDWPTNPFFDRPVQNVTSPGDFGYVRVNCDDCFLQVYGWDSVIKIWFPPRG